MGLLQRVLTVVFFLLIFPADIRAENILQTSQIPPGFAQEFTADANAKVERIFLTAYERAYLELRFNSDHHQASLLLNAPISGQTSYRGRSLLSFAAFSGFLRLAKWALETGADINLGDKDNATMLRMAVANKLEYVALFALRHGANPNLLQGASLDNTMGDMMRFGWPISGFELTWRHGARLRHNGQREELEAYLKKNTSDDYEDQNRLEHFLDLIDSPLAIVSSALPVNTSKSAALIPTYMVGRMDKALLQEIKLQKFTRTHIEQFNVHGMYLPHYLTFNGMELTLGHILSSVSPTEAATWVSKRDRTGNDLIIAAIKSLNPKLLKEVLTYSKESLNESVPDIEDYYSRGDTPLHIAIKWRASKTIFDILFEAGAAESLGIGNRYGLTPLEMLNTWYSDSSDYDRLKSIITNRD